MRKPGTGVCALVFSCSSCPQEFVILSEAKDLLFVKPRRAQVLPSGVLRFNQRNSLSPQPSLDGLLASDGIVHILEGFIVNEAMNSVISGEARIDVALVLPSAAIDVIGDASVKHPRFAG
jgi:hypothetical protein